MSRSNQKRAKAPKRAKISADVRPRLPILFLFLALFLPLIGELIQYILIGDEQVCCIPDNLDFLSARAGIAKFLRPLSNFIIGGSMLAGIILAVTSLKKVYYQTLPSISVKYRKFIFVILILCAMYIVITLAAMLLFFVVRNNLYYLDRPWPGGKLYEGEWYNPIHWWRAVFCSPFA